ncbi:aKG-HExxH-type peptide beta-hydroxylase [Streptomyces sp. PR69]|uniref:aKG-HExxH-type peptide beta-hydroxylase n=1 Tax=Streptomyces sp. PR69 TaxID=2984950 RepID=UPI002265556F|nr:HEXXH motif-containing putative peptide modification protein [Streptomyces sp. PR69]
MDGLTPRAADRPPDGERRHSLTTRQFESLARGEGEFEALIALADAETSRRLLMLDLLMDFLVVRPAATGPLPAAQRAWELLASAQRDAPETVRELIGLPETGLWLGRLLRRLHLPREDERLPLWADVGRLHALAAAAAARAGLEFSLPLPSRTGRVELPGLGQARLADRTPWGVAVLTAQDDAVTLRTPSSVLRLPRPLSHSAPGWRPLHSFQAARDRDGHPLRIILDDIGGQRIAPPPIGAARPLSAAAARRWTALLRDACALLAETDPPSAAAAHVLLRTVQPMNAHEPFRVRSVTSADAVGGCALSWPGSALSCAATLAHELQHSKLSALGHLAPLYEAADPTDRERLYYAPWRDDPRPLSGMLQGVYAFAGVARFWRAQTLRQDTDCEGLAWFESELWRRQLRHVLPAVAGDPALTDVGRRLLARLRAAVDGARADGPRSPTACRAAGLARSLARDHRALWRLHHVRPRPDDIERLAALWRRAPDAAPTLPAARLDTAPDRRERHLDARAVLARFALTTPTALHRIADSGLDHVPGVSGASRADVLWASGRAPEAVLACTAALADPHRAKGEGAPSAWAGLALALADCGRSPEAVRGLWTVPELISAVHLTVAEQTGAPPDPVALAGWLGRGLDRRV